MNMELLAIVISVFREVSQFPHCSFHRREHAYHVIDHIGRSLIACNITHKGDSK